MPGEAFTFEPLMFEAAYNDGKELWFTEYEYNALFKMNLKSRDVELAGIIPNEEFMRGRLYSSIAYCDEKLYFAPFSAQEIAEYDLKKKKFRKIPLPIPKHGESLFWKNEKFFRTVAWREKVYFIPWRYPGMLCYDTKKDTIMVLSDWVAWTEERRVNTWGYFCEFVLTDHELILPCACADAVIIFDTITEKPKYISMPMRQGDQCRLSGICYVKPFFYLVFGDGSIVKRRLEAEEEAIKEIIVPVSDVDGMAFFPVRYLDGFIYLFPFGKNDGFRVDIGTDRMEKIEWFDDEKQFDGHCFSYLASVSQNSKLYSMAGNSRRFIEYDFGGREKRVFQLFPSKSDQRLITENRKQALFRIAVQGTAVETAGTPLKMLIEILKDTVDFEGEEVLLRDIGTGKHIYATLRKEYAMLESRI